MIPNREHEETPVISENTNKDKPNKHKEALERYLNHVYFGHGYYGIKTAAKGYFNKDLYELSLKEIIDIQER